LVLFSKFELGGLYTYNVIALILSNIQVLGQTKYSFYIHPVALGNILYATTFITSDIITARYGRKEAFFGVKLCFLSQTIFTIWILIDLAHSRVNTSNQKEIYDGFSLILLPQASILVASIFSFVISQWVDISIFSYMCRSAIWIRQIVSVVVSGLIDNLVFSFCAWHIFSNNKFPLSDIIYIFVIPSLLIKFFVSFVTIPLVRLSQKSGSKSRSN